MANDGTIRLSVDVDEQGFRHNLSRLGSVAKVGLKASIAAVGAATAAVGALTKQSLDAYASFEQLTGGIETLFGNSADIVKGYAENAYKTAGLSANAYMETVTSFSASLIQGLGGDVKAAAEYANTAITDMSDNANKIGTSMTMIQNAYQGFAKQNYTMLDNLKLGYGGTQAEMARLINDSGVLGDTMTVTAKTVNQVSFDKIIEAIHVVQTQMGITGTTAKEASSTIEGSVNAMKGAWENLVAGLGNEDADLDLLIQNFVDSVGTAAENIIPRIEKIFEGIGMLVEKLAPIIAQELPVLVETILPSLLQAGASMLAGLAMGLINAIPALLEQLPKIIESIVNFLIEHIDEIITVGVEIIGALALGLIQAIPTLVAAIPQLIEAISRALLDLSVKMFEIGLELLKSLWEGIKNGTQWLIDQLAGWVDGIVESIKDFFTGGFSSGGSSGGKSKTPEKARVMTLIDMGEADGENAISRTASKTASLSRKLSARMPQIQSGMQQAIGYHAPAYASGPAPAQPTHTITEINRNTVQTVRVVPDQRGIFKLVKSEEIRRGKSLIKGEEN